MYYQPRDPALSTICCLTSTDPEENPGIDGQREPECQTDVQEYTGVGYLCQGTRCGTSSSSGGIGDLGSGKGEEQEQKCANELAAHSNEMVARLIGDEAEKWESELILAIGLVPMKSM